jgi:Heat shock protein 9/12
MSDMGRKGAGDKLSEGVTPDSQKSTFQQGKETATDAADKVAG